MKNGELSRRRLLLWAGPASWVVLACGSKEVECKAPEEGSISSADKGRRDALKYTATSPSADKLCKNCSYFKVGPGCGTCTVLPGPIDPRGTCNLYQNAG